MEAFQHELIASRNSSCEENTYEPNARCSHRADSIDSIYCMMSSPKDKYYDVLLRPNPALPKFPATHFLVSGCDQLTNEDLPIV